MIKTKLMSHQNEVLKFAGDKPYVGIFADYGTGKTLCAFSIIEKLKFRKVLVVSTKLSIDSTWCDQVREHSDFRFCVLRGTAKQKISLLDYALGKVNNPDRYAYYNEPKKPMLFLINYESVKSIYMELQKAGFDAIFADESTKIKTFNSERTLALQEISTSAKHRYLLAGFPVTEALFELYSQVKFLDGGATFGNSYYSFLNKYFVRHGYKMLIKKRSIKQILEAISPFCIRITNEVLKLPPKRYKPIEVEMTDQQRKLLTDLNETFRVELGKVKIDTKYIFALLSKSMQITDGFLQHIEYELDEEGNKTNKVISKNLEVVDTNKDEVLVELLDQIDVRKNKVVIWTEFTFSANKIFSILTKLNIPCLILTGENKSMSENRTVQLFQRTKDYNVIVCTLQKAAESITLTESKYAIYYSNMWSNDKRLNSEARIRRKGSEKHDSIMYIDLLVKGSIDKKVYEALHRKKNLIDELKTAFSELKKGG